MAFLGPSLPVSVDFGDEHLLQVLDEVGRVKVAQLVDWDPPRLLGEATSLAMPALLGQELSQDLVMLVGPEHFRQLGHFFTSLEIERAFSLDLHLVGTLACLRGLATFRRGSCMAVLAFVRAGSGKPDYLLLSGGLASLTDLGWKILLKQGSLSCCFTDIGIVRGLSESFHL